MTRTLGWPAASMLRGVGRCRRWEVERRLSELADRWTFAFPGGAGRGVMFDGPASEGEDERLGRWRRLCSQRPCALQLQRRREARGGARETRRRRRAAPLIQSLAITAQKSLGHLDGLLRRGYRVVWSRCLCGRLLYERLPARRCAWRLPRVWLRRPHRTGKERFAVWTLHTDLPDHHSMQMPGEGGRDGHSFTAIAPFARSADEDSWTPVMLPLRRALAIR